MIYGELGILPLRIDIRCRILSFWAKLNEDVEENERNLSPLIYKLVYNFQNINDFKSQWIDSLKILYAHLALEVFGIHKVPQIKPGLLKLATRN